MRAKAILIVIAALLLAGGVTAYIIKINVDEREARKQRERQEQAEEQFRQESHEAKRKAAEMLLPDAGNDLSFGRSRSTPEPKSTPKLHDE